MEEFKRQRRTGMIMIGLAMPVAVALWLAVDQLMPPILSMENLASREAFALKCWCVAVLFTLVMGVEAVAHERLGSPAFDPLARFETRRLKVNERYLQNTLEQTVAFAAAHHRSAAMRGLGAPGMALSMIVLVYVTARVAEEIAGRVGIVVLVAAFLGFEALLFWTTRRRLQDPA